MQFNTKFKNTQPVYILAAFQLLIMFAAFLGWFIHRDNLYHKDFTLDEYIVADSTVVVEDVTTDETMAGEGRFMHTPDISLAKGTYYIYVSYNANAGGSTAYAESQLLGPPWNHTVLTQN